MAKKKTKTETPAPTHDPDLLDDGIVDDDYQPGAAAQSDAPSATDSDPGRADDADDDAPDSEPASAPQAPTPDRAYVDRGDERATRYLKHFLTASEKSVMRHEREEGDAEYERFEDELTAAQAKAKGLKTKMDALSLRGRELSRTIRLGWEMRDIECIEERGTDPDPQSKSFGQVGMRTIRLDTGECIEWRPFNRSERQGSLFDEPPQPPPATTATPAPASAQA